jgi:hypothetical protein
MFKWIKEKISDFLAWRRGERRIAPPGTRGRVYAGSKDSATDVHGSKAEPKMVLKARILRANGDVEELGVISDNVRIERGQENG